MDKTNNWVSADYCNEECLYNEHGENSEGYFCNDCERFNNCEWCAETDEEVCSECINNLNK